MQRTPYSPLARLFYSTVPIMAAVFLASGATASAAPPKLDRFGGCMGLTGGNKSGFFRVEKIGDRYYLVTPLNHVFISLAVDTANFTDRWGGQCPALESYPNPYGNQAKYNNDAKAWEAGLKANLTHWGFNGLGCWCQQGVPQFTESVACLHVSEVAYGQKVAQPVPGFPDVFDPKFAEVADQQAKSLAPFADSPFRIGAFPDNEIRWIGADYWGKEGGRPTLPDGFIALPAAAPGKQYWVGEFLTKKYTTVEKLNAAYGTSFTAFTGDGDTVINATKLPNAPAHPAIAEDKKDFVEAIADRYYKTVTSAMRKYDPNHLVFSTRWALWTTAFQKSFPEHQAYNERIWKKAGEYCDIIAVNSYMDNGAIEAEHKLYSRIFAQSGKPFMITEWATFADDTQFARNPGWRRYQHQRGQFYFDQMKALLDFAFKDAEGKLVRPCLGAQWFQYYDEPSLGRPDGEKVNFGLVNVKDEPYQTALDVMRTFNLQMYDYIVQGKPLKLLDAPAPKSPGQAAADAAKDDQDKTGKVEPTSPLPEFAWSAPQGAASFVLLYSPEKCFPLGQTVRVDRVKGTDYKPKRALAAGLWYWCVCAVDEDGLTGRYSDPWAFHVTGGGTDRPVPLYLRLTDLSAWRNVSLEDGGGDGVAWAFYDNKGGKSAVSVQFTVNSLNKLTDKRNEGDSEIVWKYVGPAFRFVNAKRMSFDILTGRAVDRSGKMTVASKYVSARLTGADGKVVLDQKIDPEGALPPEAWRTSSFPLADAHHDECTSIEFYIDTKTEGIPWDQRLTVWLSNIRFETTAMRR